ncbi:hypothetical protein [Bradyrhizobium vignae]|uniref:hypothetical protein n=1 Tax=Bradyrhizobium vignae TaxID=1549949 RepID=UPI00100C040D|nr:hypothetical protein [Bradyrhizobium vignae]RXH02777.1 hypothetical protein EAV90_15140 [Bradyrhizobium vignae]
MAENPKVTVALVHDALNAPAVGLRYGIPAHQKPAILQCAGLLDASTALRTVGFIVVRNTAKQSATMANVAKLNTCFISAPAFAWRRFLIPGLRRAIIDATLTDCCERVLFGRDGRPRLV